MKYPLVYNVEIILILFSFDERRWIKARNSVFQKRAVAVFRTKERKCAKRRAVTRQQQRRRRRPTSYNIITVVSVISYNRGRAQEDTKYNNVTGRGGKRNVMNNTLLRVRNATLYNSRVRPC